MVSKDKQIILTYAAVKRQIRETTQNTRNSFLPRI